MRPLFYRLILSLGLLTGACSDTSPYDACGDVTCSGHGACVMEQGAPTCRCDPGYSPAASGWLCIDTTATSPCAGLTCSGHGACLALGGSPTCRCDPGYQKSADGLSCLDPCKGVLCSGVGTCLVESGKARCSCPAGYWIAPDGMGCEGTAMGGFTTYYLTWDRYPTWYIGLISLDSRKWSKGLLVERLKYNLTLDSGGRGLHRTAMQTWNLNPAGSQVTALQLEDYFTQSTVNRRRRLSASFSKGAASVTMQRQDKEATYQVKYTGTSTPLPAFGAKEFPGWTIGSVSPVFYALALQRFDRAASGDQPLEVFYPTVGAVGQVTMKKHPSWTAANPALHFPELQVTVIYDKDVPREIHLDNEGLTLKRTTVPLADLNLPPASTPTQVTVTPPPTAGQELATSFSSTDSAKLAGTLTLPKASAGAKSPAVLLVPGPWALDRDHPHRLLLRRPLFGHLAAHLAQAGFASLRYDPRGRGQSGGAADEATLGLLLDDAAAALKSLSEHGAVDSTRVFVLSHGASAPLALGLLARAGGAVRGYAGLAPFVTNLKEALIHSFVAHLTASEFTSGYVDNQKKYYRAELDRIVAGSQRKAALEGLPAALWKGMLAFDGAKVLAAYPGPALLLRGAEDLVSPPDQLTLAAKACQQAGRDLTAITLSDRAFDLTAGKASGLWESAAMPMELPKDSLDGLLNWLKVYK